ncbi:hypothetical protein PRIPAC_87515, partial [Pristionchus pacificus]
MIGKQREVAPVVAHSAFKPKKGWIIVGKIQYDTKIELGSGSGGTIVFRGTYAEREVAVKRVLKQNVQLATREVKALIESDSDDNVIRYFDSETDNLFRYLVLELCIGSLSDYVENRKPEISLTSEEILRQATKGLSHLHSLKIVHRDLKPSNILFSTRGGTVRAVISDFGLCKKIKPDMNSLSSGSGIVGSMGWMSPEALKLQSTSFPTDIFSIGLVFYYVLTGGSHPYGEHYQRSSNIVEGKYSLIGLKTAESRRLISLALTHSPISRPKASEILSDPFFWENKERLDFFCEASDRFVGEDFKSLLSKRIMKNGKKIKQHVKTNWTNELCDELKNYVQTENDKFHPYTEWSLRDLIRLIRNLKHHYWDLPDSVRSSIGENINKLDEYFTGRFPHLLLHVYEAMEWCSDEPAFQHYYSDEIKTRMESERRQAMYTTGESYTKKVRPDSGMPTAPQIPKKSQHAKAP